ncbi:hypothetical protein OUZ56_028686 [Daphnia magna]|uniref:Uncharacterized protein n=1 Tax=Daphnia magna TaxID=35525 RepID=A0ABR0B4L9_9CRUS|nr:hypothetical protein OUZ56_028686 [Daphnia magna]
MELIAQWLSIGMVSQGKSVRAAGAGFPDHHMTAWSGVSRVLQTTTWPLGKGNFGKDLTDPPSSFQAIARPLSHHMLQNPQIDT